MILSASASFAATDDIALSEASDDIAIEENVLTDVDDSSLLSDNGQGFDVGENFGPVNVTADNFFDYFDDSGTLYDNVSTSELVFSGDFSEIGVGYITIGRSITFTGHDATFDGATFVVMADDVTIDGLTITQSSDVYAINVYGSSGIVISNNFIEYTALEGFDSYGIYATASSDLSILNNTIVYYGNTNGTVVNNAIRIEGDDENEIPFTDIVVSGNIIDITIPSADKSYEQYTYEETAISEGIVFYYVEDLEFVGNRVDVRFNDVTSTSSYDSINVISVRSDAYTFGEIQSNNILIADNNITVDGYSCVYPVYVCADNFNITGNIIVSTAENYLAHGIDVDGPSSKGIVADNDVTVEAPVAAYGIYSYQWLGPVEDITYYNNTISVAAYCSAGMELVECNPTVLYNTITAEGNYTYGIIASCRDEGTIAGNTINALGSNTGSDATGDGLMTRNTMGISVKGASEITDNTVYSTNVGLNFAEDGETLVEGNTITVEATGLVDNYAIYAKSVDDLTFIDNTITFIGYSNGTVASKAVRIDGDDKKFVPVKNIKFEGNTFYITIPSADVEYDWTTYEPTVYSEGIAFYYVENVEFVNNTVEVGYNDVTSASGYDSLYAVSVKGNPYIYDFDDDDELIYPVVSKNVLISDNDISIEGHGCVYAVWAGAENLTIAGNDIYSSSETYLAHGIDIDSNSAGVYVVYNTITAEAPLATYGICADGYMGPVTDSTYIGNNVTVTGYSSIGIKVVVDPSPAISENIVYAEGNYTYGIIANNGIASGNTVYALGSNTGSDPTGDSYMQKNSVGISVKATDLLGNNVYSTNTGLNIVQEGGMTIEDNTITVENNALVDSYGIYAKGVDDLAFTNNIITYVGYSNGTIVNNAVRISGDDKKLVAAKNIAFEGNTFDITIPSCDVEYDWTTYEPTVYSEGIVLYYVEDVEFVNNTVEVGYNDVTSASGYDSIYGVSVKGNPYIYDFDDDDELIYPVVSKNVVISDNDINVEGHGCVYAVWAGAENLTIAGNDIYSSSETYLAHGIDIDSNTVTALVSDNTIIAIAPASYGICADGFMGPVTDSSYINNTVTVAGYSSIGIKVVVDSDPVIADNTVVSEGNYTYGIIANNGVVSGNDVRVLGFNTGSDPTGDSYMKKNSVGISVKDTDVVGNTVSSTDIGINIIESDEILVDGNRINVVSNTEDINNHAIVASNIAALTISNNKIDYIGATAPKENYTAAKAYAVYLINSTVVMENNILDIQVPSIPADWEETPPGSWNYVRHAYSEGVVFDGCDNSVFSANDITLGYTDGSYGSIYVVDLLDSDFFMIRDNVIDATGEYYLYGIILESEDFVILNNTISVESDYYTNCIDLEGVSYGNIDSNTLSAISPETAYPIYGGMVNPVSGEITNNEIYAESYYAVGIELSGTDVTIDNNIIVLDGNYTIGVGTYADNLIVSNNTIVSKASNIGDVPIWDSLGTDTVGVKSLNGAVTIIDNNITSNGEYTVDIGDCEGTVNSNHLLAESLKGDRSVYSIGSATVYDNTPINTVLIVPDVVAIDNDSAKVVATLEDVYGNPVSGMNVKITVGTLAKTIKTDENGQAVLDISSLEPGQYDVKVKAAMTDLYDRADPVTATAIISDGKIDTLLVVPDAIARCNVTGSVVATFMDIYGNAISGVNVKITVGDLAKTLKSDADGKVALDISSLAPGEYKVNVKTATTDIYNRATETAKAIVSEDKFNTTLTVPNVVMIYNTTGSVVATFSDIYGNAVSGANVKITVGDLAKTLKTDENGQVALDISSLAPGEYKASVKTATTDIYNRASPVTATVIVSEEKVDTELIVPNVVALNGTGTVFATFKDIYGNVISGVNVKVTVGDLAKTVATDTDGQVALDISSLAPGEYTISVKTATTDVYNKAVATATAVITAEKVDTVLIVPDVATMTGTGSVVATLQDIYGNAVSGVNVKVTVGDLAKTLKTDANGQVALDISSLAPGEYTISVKTATTDLYNRATPVTATAIVTEDKIDTVLSAEDVTTTQGSGDELLVILTDVYGNLVSGLNVKITVGDLAKTLKTDECGQVALDVSTLAPGNYTAVIKSASSAVYNNAAQITAAVTILE